MYVGNSGTGTLACSGTFNQSGGTVNLSNGYALILGYNASDSGTYLLSTLRCSPHTLSMWVCGSGNFPSRAARIRYRTSQINGGGTYNLSGGALLVPGVETISGTSTTSAERMGGGYLEINYGGMYNLTAGALSCPHSQTMAACSTSAGGRSWRRALSTTLAIT